jgi:hypothetical protein
MDAKEIHLTKSRDSKNPGGYEGALGFRVIDSNTGEDYYAAFLTADGSPGLDYDHAALMFYAYEKQAGMQLGVGPGSQSVDNDIKSPHIAALRVQRVNGPDEEAMVWISTKKGVDPNMPRSDFQLSKQRMANCNHSRSGLGALLSAATMRTGQSLSSGRAFPFLDMSLRMAH